LTPKSEAGATLQVQSHRHEFVAKACFTFRVGLGNLAS
jgi:hypothetical protein